MAKQPTAAKALREVKRSQKAREHPHPPRPKKR